MIKKISMTGLFIAFAVLFAFVISCQVPGSSGSASYTFEFENDNQGWKYETQAGHQGIILANFTTTLANSGTGALLLDGNLSGSVTNRIKGEAFVTLDPYIDLSGKTLSCYVYCPTTLLGNGQNQMAIFAKDRYETFASIPAVTISSPTIIANNWNLVSGTLEVGAGFDITQIKAVGLQVTMSTANTCTDNLYLDSFGW